MLAMFIAMLLPCYSVVLLLLPCLPLHHQVWMACKETQITSIQIKSNQIGQMKSRTAREGPLNGVDPTPHHALAFRFRLTWACPWSHAGLPRLDRVILRLALADSRTAHGYSWILPPVVLHGSRTP